MREININHITKIEGHAKLHLTIDKGEIKKCELSATEGARFFEGLVKGRKYFEAHEMTSRICGICSCGHVIAAIKGIEDAIGVEVSEQTRLLRVLLTLGERIRSHATHLYFLALPDYLGFESALAMAGEYKKELKTALHMMKVGNHMVTVIGGRDMHPVSATIGGWLALPKQDALDQLTKDLHSIRKDAIATCKLFSSLKYPDFDSEGEWFALVRDDTYAVIDGEFRGPNKTYDRHNYHEFIKEYHEPYSTANFVVAEGKRYFVGALCRLNHSSHLLLGEAKRLLEESPIKLPSTNPYHQNIAQAIELIHSIDHALDILAHLKIVPEKPADHQKKAGRGVGVIEVPRGTLWHEYEVDENGVITYANIVTPTAQNLLNMQEDIRLRVPGLLDKPKDDVIIDVEQLIRSYDPCFSCSAHFLEVDWNEL